MPIMPYSSEKIEKDYEVNLLLAGMQTNYLKKYDYLESFFHVNSKALLLPFISLASCSGPQFSLHLGSHILDKNIKCSHVPWARRIHMIIKPHACTLLKSFADQTCSIILHSGI